MSSAAPVEKKKIRKASPRNIDAKPTGMGAIPLSKGVAFRVWAPHADQVFVMGAFNHWADDQLAMKEEVDGIWFLEVPDAKIGDEYRYLLHAGDRKISRLDPYAREVTSSVGNSVVHDPKFDWGDDNYQLPPWNEIVVYELHIGAFNNPGGGEHPAQFKDVIEKLGHLKRLGVNVIQVMPIAEFAGEFSWGYNPAQIFAVEGTYGGPKAFKELVKAAHAQGIGVILDVVYNHFGPGDLDLWQFDGWSENDLGGVYFYNDARSETPWGNSRPDYGRGEVRQFIRDNAMMWLEECHVDGLRFDMTLFIRTVRGPDQGGDLPEGWSLLQWINREVRDKFPGRLTIAEDLQNSDWLTKDDGAGGAGFGAQWDAKFVHPIRAVVSAVDDEQRSLQAVCDSLTFAYNGDPFERVVYSESHDEVANGKSRVPSEIDAADPENYFAQKRSTLAAALVFTAPGIPMLFQGQEFLQGGWFQDTVPIDWHLNDSFRGIVRLYRDLVRLRLNRQGLSRGLCGRGIHISHVNEILKVMAFHRWDKGGHQDDVVVVANFSSQVHSDYQIGFPRDGVWKLRLNSDWKGYSSVFGNDPSTDATPTPDAYDGQPCSAKITIAPYSVLIYSQDA